MKMNWKLGIAMSAALAMAACNSGDAGKAGENKAGNTSAAGNTTGGSTGGEGNTSGGGEATENSGGAAGGGEAAGAQQDFTIVNNTGNTVMTLNVSPSNENEWGPDILGQDTLGNGERAQISFARGQDQCNWDIRVTYDDNETGDWRGINLCETATVTLTAQ
jgi:hypothetical protein